jgi:hypothetical protein
MYKFINKLGIMAYNMDMYNAGDVNTNDKEEEEDAAAAIVVDDVRVIMASNRDVGAAKKCKAGMAVAEPIKV